MSENVKLTLLRDQNQSYAFRYLRSNIELRNRASERCWEIDALRGVAVIMMIIYHLLYDLYYLRVTDSIFTNPFWFYFQRTTATLFIALTGVSLALRQRPDGRGYIFVAKRGMYLFGWGTVLSAVTWLFLGPELYIRFGILHFIGVATLLSYPFLRWRTFNIALGSVLVGVGIWLQQFRFDPPWSYLFWLGLEPVNHSYVDFFPLVRWFGVVLIGIGMGNWLYGTGRRRFLLPDLSSVPPIHGLQILGRRSLLIYLLHQPLLMLLLLLGLWIWRVLSSHF